MPEGHTILRAKRRIEDALAGRQVSVTACHARARLARVEQLDGRVLERVEARGKNLLLVFGELTLHSHLGMVGRWEVGEREMAWRRPAGAVWMAISDERSEAVQIAGPTLRVIATRKLAADPRLARLGPDILSPVPDLGGGLARFRQADGCREIGEALLDQNLVAGIGNIFKSEACFAARVSPWTTLDDVADSDLLAVLAAARQHMLAAAEANRPAGLAVYRRRGQCVRCGGRIRSRGQGDENRITWWCERCQGSGPPRKRAGHTE